MKRAGQYRCGTEGPRKIKRKIKIKKTTTRTKIIAYGPDTVVAKPVCGADIHRRAGAADERVGGAGLEHGQPDVAHARPDAAVVRQIRVGRSFRGRSAPGGGSKPRPTGGEPA